MIIISDKLYLKLIQFHDIEIYKQLQEEFGDYLSNNFNDFDFANKIKKMSAMNQFIYMLHYNDEVIGSIQVIIEEKLSLLKPIARLENVIIAKKYRNQQFGKQMVQGLINHLQSENKYSRIMIYCSENNVSFYKKCNFYLTKGCSGIIYC